jgi:hypothetical protein
VIDKGTMLLQNCMDILNVEPGSVSETCPTSSHDGDQIIDVKVEEDPVPIPFKEIKAEHEVSCIHVCPLLGTFHRNVYCLSHLDLSVQMEHLHCP